jgi:hypothetical protein
MASAPVSTLEPPVGHLHGEFKAGESATSVLLAGLSVSVEVVFAAASTAGE